MAVYFGDSSLHVILAQGLILQVNMRASNMQFVPLYSNTNFRFVYRVPG